MIHKLYRRNDIRCVIRDFLFTYHKSVALVVHIFLLQEIISGYKIATRKCVSQIQQEIFYDSLTYFFLEPNRSCFDCLVSLSSCVCYLRHHKNPYYSPSRTRAPVSVHQKECEIVFHVSTKKGSGVYCTLL